MTKAVLCLFLLSLLPLAVIVDHGQGVHQGSIIHSAESEKTLRIPHEYQEQMALFEWTRLHESHEPRLSLLFCIPNGELRDKRTAAKLERMGVRPGVSDLFLSVPRISTPPLPS